MLPGSTHPSNRLGSVDVYVAEESIPYSVGGGASGVEPV